jgi:hypothetical protein
MSRLIFLLMILSALMIGLAACSDDTTTPQGGGGDVAEGTLTPDGPGFEIELELASGPDSLHRGPFLLRGGIPVWAAVFQGLVVELTVTNNGEVSYAEPVSIHFFRMIPDSTLILNSPDDSPSFTFEFANDDGVWTPGEESLPLMVVFSAEPGQSVGFNAHIGLGGPVGLYLGGKVWLDTNRNGVIDPDERGLGGIPLVADDGSDQEILRQVFTAPNGTFGFHNLDRGTWEIRVLTVPDGLESTTPSNLHVLLTHPGGVIGGFTEADFGFAEFGKPRD